MRIVRQLFQKLPPLLALALSVSLFVPGSVYGQTSLSLQAGASLATLGGSDVASADSRIGMRVGASAIFPLSANLDLQFGAAYAAKGATKQELGVDVALELDYFEIPLLLRLSPSDRWHHIAPLEGGRLRRLSLLACLSQVGKRVHGSVEKGSEHLRAGGSR